MGIYRFELIHPRDFRPTGRHFSNNDIVHFSTVQTSYQLSSSAESQPSPPINFDERSSIISNNDPKDKYDELADIMSKDYMDDIVNESSSESEEMVDEETFKSLFGDDTSMIHNGDADSDVIDENKIKLLKEEFDYNLVTLKENCEFFTNIIDRGDLYEFMENNVDKEELNMLLEEMESFLWNIYTSSEDILYVMDNVSVEEAKSFKLKNYTYSQIDNIKYLANDLLIVSRKASELDKLTPDEKDYLLNKILVLKDVINESSEMMF